jgi:hypothetical protein
MLFVELRQLGDGATHGDPDGASSGYGRRSDDSHDDTTPRRNHRASNAYHHTGGRPNSNTAAERARYATAQHAADYTDSGNAWNDAGKYPQQHYDAGIEHAFDAVRSAGTWLAGNGRKSWNDQSNNARIHDSEFKYPGFQQSRFDNPIAAWFGKHKFCCVPSGNRA